MYSHVAEVELAATLGRRQADLEPQRVQPVEPALQEHLHRRLRLGERAVEALARGAIQPHDVAGVALVGRLQRRRPELAIDVAFERGLQEADRAAHAHVDGRVELHEIELPGQRVAARATPSSRPRRSPAPRRPRSRGRCALAARAAYASRRRRAAVTPLFVAPPGSAGWLTNPPSQRRTNGSEAWSAEDMRVRTAASARTASAASARRASKSIPAPATASPATGTRRPPPTAGRPARR